MSDSGSYQRKRQKGPRKFRPCASEFCERIEPAPSSPHCKEVVLAAVAFTEGVDVIEADGQVMAKNKPESVIMALEMLPQ